MPVDLPPPAIVIAAPPEAAAPSALDDIRAARLRGDLGGARAQIDRALSAAPSDADIWLERGLVALAQGDAAEAQAAFLRTLQIAPTYDDARLGLARLAYREGDVAGARTWLAGVSASRRDDSEVAALQALLQAPTGDIAWRLDLSGAYSALSSGRAPWREAVLALSRRDGDNTLGVRIDDADRFGSSDTYGEVVVAHALGAGVVEFAVGGASDADFMPQAQMRMGFIGREHDHWSFEGAVSLARYNAGDVDTLSVGVTYALKDWRVGARPIVVRDETGRTRSGYGVRLAWGADDAPQLSLAWTDAPESSEGVTVGVRSTAVAFGFNVSEHVRLRMGALWEERDAYDRSEASLALTRTF